MPVLQGDSEFRFLLQHMLSTARHCYQQHVTMLSFGSTAFKVNRMFGLVTGFVPVLCLRNSRVHCFQIYQGAVCLGSTTSKTTTAEQTLYSVES